MPRSKTYGGPGLTGQLLRDTAFADAVPEGAHTHRPRVTRDTPTPPVIDPLEPTFYAGLSVNTDADLGGGNSIDGNFNRNTLALYVGKDGKTKVAAIDEARHEWSGSTALGILMEQASTNICTNYNAEPDAALRNMNVVGNGTLTRSSEPDLIAASGLEDVCTSGYVFRAQAGAGGADLFVAGGSANTNNHRVSCYVRTVSATVKILLNADTANELVIPVDTLLKRYDTLGVPDQAGRQFLIRLSNGAECFFVLNQVEEQEETTSAIVTSGAATSRAADSLSWDYQSPNFIRGTAGMSAIVWRPGFNSASSKAESQRSILSLADVPQSLIFHDFRSSTHRFSSWNGTNLAEALIAGNAFSKNDVILIANRWNQSGNQFQIGYKKGGTWVWGTPVAWNGMWGAGTVFRVSYQAEFPDRNKAAYIWWEDKGTSWIESFFSGIAN